MHYIKSVSGLIVTKAKAASLATPSASSDGVVLADWDRFSGMGWANAVVSLFADGAANVSSPKLYGFGPYGDSGANAWVYLGDLNNGNTIALTATVGYAEQVQLPAIFTSLAVGGTVDANNVGYNATPLDVYSA